MAIREMNDSPWQPFFPTERIIKQKAVYFIGVCREINTLKDVFFLGFPKKCKKIVLFIHIYNEVNNSIGVEMPRRSSVKSKLAGRNLSLLFFCGTEHSYS